MKSNSFILFVLLFFAVLFSSAQQRVQDSLLKMAAEATSDSARSEAYLKLAQNAVLNNPKMAISYVHKSLALYQKYGRGFPYWRYQNKTTAYRLLGLVDSAIYYCNKMLAQATKENQYKWLADAYGEFGLISITQNNFSKGIEYFNKQHAIIKKHKLDTPFSAVYNNIGIAYGNKGDWDMAFEYFSRATKYDQEKNFIKYFGNDYNNLGIVYIVKEKFDSAKKYFSLSLKYRRSTNDMLGVGGSLNNLALLEKAQKNYSRGLALADSAFQIAIRHGFKKLQVEVYDTYDQLYSQMGDYKKAYEFLNKKNQLNNLFEKEEYKNKVQELESNMALEQKQTQLLEKDLELSKAEQQKQKQLSVIVLGTILVGALLLFLFNFFKNNRVLKERNNIISVQKNLLEQKHKDITDSINYAQKIQSALIISEDRLNKHVKEAFVLFKPRDIVSGDFYWFAEHGGRKILALADCTGHGVPGAFMSMIGITLLNQIVKEKGITSPAQILNHLRKEVIGVLSIDGSDKRDGMDMALISFNDTELSFAGANCGAIILENNSIRELKPNKQPIGVYEKQEDFTEEKVVLAEGTRVYLFSDGIVDQFGGPEGKKLKIKQFREWLLESSAQPFSQQKKNVEEKLNNWKKGFDQTDDISLIGVKLS